LDCIAKGYDVTSEWRFVVLDKTGLHRIPGTGTSHGTPPPYSYDTHVPLFYGWHIKKGETHDRKVITQIASTQRLRFLFPNGTEAHVLLGF
jgi:hypothetical protein